MNKPDKRRLTPAFLFLCGLALVVVGLVTSVLVKGVSSEKIIWDMPMAFPESNYQTQTAKGFAEDIYSCTDGGLGIKIHANGSLFKGIEIKRAVQTGQAPIGERLLSTHANEDMLFTLDSIPFVASGYAESEKLWKVAEATLKAVLEEENLVLIYSVPWPPQGIYFDKEVNSTDDIAGMRFRSYSAATGRIAELAGMIPVLIESAELPHALATGIVQTLMASGSTGYDSKIWEHLSYYYDIEAWRPRNYVFINRDEYMALADETRDCIHRAGRRAEKIGTQESLRLGQWYLAQLKKNGMHVVKPGPRFKADLAKIGEKMTQEWLSATGERGKEILAAYYE